MNGLQSHLIPATATIVEALDSLNRLSGETMTLFVIEEGETQPPRLIGSLTDGDIRRALLGGRSLTDRVESICKGDCLRLSSENDIAVISKARGLDITLLPVVDADGAVISMVDLRRQRGLVPADGVLMAGGIGERLRPLTQNTPKPLLPVGGRPLIDLNVELMSDFGIRNIFVTVNYLKEQIMSHFQTHSNGGEEEGSHEAFQDKARVECIAEPRRLGTIGSLSLIENFSSPHVVVMNADLLTDINLEAMYLKHIATEAWLTMAVIPYAVSIPYAIVEHSADRVEGLTEKPTYNYYANAGIYMLRREVAESIPKDTYMDATDLIDSLLREGRRVTQFKIDGRWIDIGSPDDYRHACEVILSGEKMK